ncbi:collagen-binding domain-containing protein [Polaribacter dokdonensis]|uniref:Choice-of-anchor A domain-containing protein n=1 Tax=Polaribacter dokdonensis DSW-5 TaxID=1300348 RepID=A0A1H5K1W9_9FLAO|nr:collagen-binding domain-containing protein [Polaribacter dokdonensis]SEE58745.1 choice-of-anchor A domain-containing protein [Polaribacter dokdonensis DSW-5]
MDYVHGITVNKKNTSILKIGVVFLLIFFSTLNINAQCVNATDCDGDGISNSIDLDDDNDGILDTDEFSCPTVASGSIVSFIIDSKPQTTSSKTVNSFSNSASPFSQNTSYTLSYGTSLGKRLEGFELSSGNIIKVDEDASVGNITFRRATSGSAPTNQIIWIENDGHTNTTNATQLHTTEVSNMAETFSHGFYNVGSDNVFDNSTSSQNNNNIERVDVVFDDGYFINSNNNQYVTVGERGKNNFIDIAIITSIDSNGTPTSYSSVYRVTTASMTTIEKLPSTVLRKEISDTEFRPSTALNQDVAIRAVTFADFGVANGTTIYGYSIFPPDYNTSNLLDWTTFPTNTNSSLGGLDLVLFNYFSSDCIYRDTDGDGLPDSKDTDSDNDGCPDAIEGLGAYTSSEVNNTLAGGSNGGSLLNFPPTINNNGIPTAVGTTIGGNETFGQATSTNVVTAEQINITIFPTSTTVNKTDNATFTAGASSISTTTFVAGSPDYTIPPGTNTSGTLSYKWFKNSAPSTILSTATTLNINAATIADIGDYTLQIIGVDNNCPEEVVFTLSVNDTPTTVDDTFSVNENSYNNSLDVLNNDTFGNDGPNTGTIVLPSGSTANGGTVTVDDAGTPNDPTDDKILYTPSGSAANDSFTYTIIDSNGDTSTANVNLSISSVVDCNDSPTAPAQGFNVFVEQNMNVKSTETKGSVAVGRNLNIKGDYNVATDDCGDFDTNGLKTGLLVGNKVNYPLNTVINTADDICNCGDPTIVNNGSFETGAVTNTWTLKDEADIPGWYTTATDNKIEIWKSGFQGKNAQSGNYIAEINANQRAALYQVICAEPGSVLNWSIWHRGRRGIDVANVKIGVSLNSASIEETMSTDQNAWVNYTGSYTVPAGEHTVYFVFESVSSQPYNNLSYGNLIDNFEVTKTTTGTCPAGGSNPNGLLTVVNPNYYTKIGKSSGSVAWYFDEQNAAANMRVTPNGTYNSSSRIQMNNNSPTYGVSSGNNPVYEINLIDFSSAFQSLRANGTNMASNTNNATLEDDNSNPITNTTLTSQTEIILNNGVNYLNVTGSDLNSVDGLTFKNSPSANKVLIVNVNAPGNFNWDVWEQIGITSAESPFILYNFFNSDKVNIRGTEAIYGTIFAPSSKIRKVNNKEDIYGQVIGKTFTHDGGVIHCNKFAATSTCPTFVGVAPSSGFDINVNPQCFVANDFSFTNTTQIIGVPQPEAPITYSWDFGDGTTSTSMDVSSKVYSNPGTYTVALTATNIYGTSTYTEQVTVLPVLEPIVSVVNLPSPTGKIIKQYTIDNASSFTDFSWTLPGNGSQSGPGLLQNQNPITYEFTNPGMYTISVTATSNDCTTTIDVPATVTSGEVTGGNSGGVESESLGDAISKIYVGRKKNSVPTTFVKSDANLYNKAKMKAEQPYQGKGQTMLDMFPTELVAGNVANVTSPTDILDYTVADEVLSVDFSLDGKTKGVVLGVKTSDKIYNHTKASCDRLRGAEILNIQTVQLEGYNFLMQGIKQRNGVVEYAISFATAKNNNDTNYTIQTNWYVNNYIKFNDVYNFQVWTTNPADTQKLVVDILNNLKAFIPVTQTEVQKVPKTYAAKISREKNELVVLLRSTQKGLNTEISMEEIYSETANNVKFRYNPVNTELEQTLRVDIADGYEYDGLVKVDGEVEDAFYHADGNWGLDFDASYTKIKDYFVSNSFDRTYQDDEHAINRNVALRATSDFDYLTLYKSLLPGTLAADYSEYNYLSFTAKGSGLIELGLIKKSIEDWKAQYRVMVDLSEEEQTYYVPFDIFTSSASQENLTAEDLTTLLFTFLPVEAQTKELDLTISDVKFTKIAVEDQIVNKIEKFENEFMAYPNPSQGNVNLLLFSQVDTEATVTLTDITGKTIYKENVNLNTGKNELDFNFKVKTGVMLLKVASKETNYGTSKIIFR